MAAILVINPNSTESMTRVIDEACEPLRIAGGPAIESATLKEGPPGIETQQQVDGLIAPLLALVRKNEPRYDAFVIACYSDPGLHSVREVTRKPVLGIAECGILTALTLGHRFGVIAILQQSIARHLRYMGALGVMDRLAGERPVGLRVTELSDSEKTFARMVEVGHIEPARIVAHVVEHELEWKIEGLRPAGHTFGIKYPLIDQHRIAVEEVAGV